MEVDGDGGPGAERASLVSHIYYDYSIIIIIVIVNIMLDFYLMGRLHAYYTLHPQWYNINKLQIIVAK